MRIWVLTLFAFSLVASAADKPGGIKARVKPGRSGVWIDGKYAGPASRFSVPEKYTADAGEHEVTFRDPRYEDLSIKVTVKPGKTTTIRGKMKAVNVPPPPYGRLRFGGGESESFISVTAGDVSPIYLNGRFYGYVDEFNNAGSGMLLPPGTYRLKMESPIFETVDQDVTVTANKVTVVPLKTSRR
ncbi:MAG: PEGA domain-containing protein [Candidatus Solibacter usitatus]|nr:PEGA domain-containing protein [Candidatus Solibacter usitatus]